MKIVMITAGSRGDFEPYIALGKALKKLGHEVTVPGPTLFKELILENGLTYLENNSYDTAEMMKKINMEKAASQKNKLAFIAREFRKAKGVIRDMLHSYWKNSQGMDAIVSTPAFPASFSIARKLNIPCFFALLMPIHPTTAFPSPMAPRLFNLGPYNKMTHKMTEQMLWQPFRSLFNHWQQKVLGIKPEHFFGPFRKIDQDPAPMLCGFSPTVIQKPDDWSEKLQITGAWFLDQPQGWQPPAELESFLDNGPPPIYIGFGSMMGKNPERITKIVCDALKATGQRGLLSSGWGGLGNTNLPENVMQIGSVPHSWLFGKMKAIVHHGGAGTTHASLGSGVPTIVTPFLADQPFWGDCVYRLGCGPKPIPYADLTSDSLAGLIHCSVHDEKMRQNAKAIAEKLQAENGVEAASKLVDVYLKN